jgi:hydroxyacylglutathione hydrolase
MIVKQFYHGFLGHTSYLIGDESTRMAILVDPQDCMEIYHKEAFLQNLQIHFVFLTHLYPEFLRAMTNSSCICSHTPLYVHHRIASEDLCNFAFKGSVLPVKEGDQLEFGNLKLQVLETPGHQEKAISLLFYNLAQNPETPMLLLVGDLFFLGNLGNLSLATFIEIQELEHLERIYHSLQKVICLPESLLVGMAHGSLWWENTEKNASCLENCLNYNPVLKQAYQQKKEDFFKTLRSESSAFQKANLKKETLELFSETPSMKFYNKNHINFGVDHGLKMP